MKRLTRRMTCWLVIVAVIGLRLAAQARPARHTINDALLSASFGDYGAVERLLDKGADVNARDEDGRTPLIIAAHIGRVDITRLLLRRGANFRLRSRFDGDTSWAGGTALQVAVMYEQPKVARVLKAAGERQ